MGKATPLTKEQARAIKKHKAAKRTLKRFKYVNAAVRQGMILGNDKLVFITMCELADDSGWIWHGQRSLAELTGYSQKTVDRCLDRLIAQGAVLLMHKGKSKWDSSMYRVVEIDTEKSPTIYSMAKNRRLQKQSKVKQPKLQLSLCDSVKTFTESLGLGRADQLSLCDSKDMEFDFDPLISLERYRTASLRSASAFGGCSTPFQNELKNQSQGQPRTGSLDGCATKPRATPESKPCPDCGQPQHWFKECYEVAANA